jgi:D-serine deaminase-like pyridoxal phosphate-dependent protein
MNYDDWKRLLAGEPLPAAVVDLDALDRNIALLAQSLGDRDITLRVASKSVRHPWLLRHILDHGGQR